ncbi:MAG: ATP synthase F0 subunit B [Candidatus Sulfotelmatobacter sp.]
MIISPHKLFRAIALALLVTSFASLPATSRAQQQPAAAQQPQQKPQQKPQQRGFGQELVHESREVAGEEKDENAEFKQSTSVSLIAKWTGMSLRRAYWLSVLLNFAFIAGVIFWAARKYLPGTLSARTAAIQQAMREAQKASEEARRRLADIESRLTKLDGEIGRMRDAAEKDSAEEEARSQAAAQEESRKIIESAQQEIAAAAKSARRQLTAYAADLAVGLAKKQIHVDAATDQTLVRNFAAELGSSPAGSTGSAGKDGH